MFLSTYLSSYLAIYLSISSAYRTMYLSISPSTYLSIYLSACLPVYLSTCLSASLKTKLFCEMSSGFELDNIKNAAFLRDFLLFELDNVKNEAILRDFLQKWKVACSADGLVPMRFAIFPSICLACHEQVMPGHTKCCTCHAKSSQQIWRSDAPKCNPSQDISGKCIFADPLQICHACHCLLKCYKTLTFCSLLTRSTIPCACHAKAHLNVKKWSLHGRRGTSRHRSSLCVAGVALMALGWLWWRAWFPFRAVGAAAVCVAGVALGDIDRHFAWQAWHWWHSAGSGGALGSRLVPWAWPLFASQAWNCWHWAGSGGALGSHLVPWARPLFAWQGWHLATSTVTLRGRRGTWRHRSPLCVTGVALMALDWLWCHTKLFHTILSQIHFTHNFVTHNSLAHNFVTYITFTHKLLHTTLSHTTLLHTTLLHTQTHTTLSHTALSPNLSRTISFPSCLSHLIFTSAWWSLEEVDLWGYPVL